MFIKMFNGKCTNTFVSYCIYIEVLESLKYQTRDYNQNVLT